MSLYNINELKEILIKYRLIKIFRWMNKIYKFVIYSYRYCKFSVHRNKRKRRKIDQKYIGLKKYKDIYSGRRCFIIATGPSLQLADIEKLYEEVTFSMNSIIKIFHQTKWRPTYYVIQDRSVYEILKNEKEFKSLSNKFIADFIVESKTFSEKQNFNIFPLNLLDHMHPKEKFRIPYFSNDIYTDVCDGYTVTYAIIQIAVYMGFKEIYLVGVDCNYSTQKQHFIDYGKRIEHHPERNMIDAYKVARQYAESHEIKIFNATRGGKLEVFERINFDSLFETDNEGENGTKDNKQI